MRYEYGCVFEVVLILVAVPVITSVVAWFFLCVFVGNVDGFDGVTIAEFDADMKICDLKEFQSKAEHCYPYGE